MAARIEHVRVAIPVRDRLMERGDIVEAELFHRLVGKRLANARRDAGKRFGVAERIGSDFAQVVRRAVAILRDDGIGHERDRIGLSGNEAMIRVVTVGVRAHETGLRVVAHAIALFHSPFDFLGARKVETGERDRGVAVLVDGEDGFHDVELRKLDLGTAGRDEPREIAPRGDVIDRPHQLFERDARFQHDAEILRGGVETCGDGSVGVCDVGHRMPPIVLLLPGIGRFQRRDALF
ncbi:MAG: hypothetical protein JWN90_253 [Parcubacteria group bacterium]|nr:hypothetical protein [Parcubacteria group bacterium]